MSSGEFSVHQFFPDDTHECVAFMVDAKTAVETAHSYTIRPTAKLGIIRRVVITDAGDFTCFEWKFGQGVVYPPKEATL